jgi:hypothetical protein
MVVPYYWGYVPTPIDFCLPSVLHLGKPNAKTLWKRLNMLQKTKEDVEHLLKEERKSV